MKVLYIINSLGTGGAERSMVEITSANSKDESYFIALFNTDSDMDLPKKNYVKYIKLNLPKNISYSEIIKQIIPEVHKIEPDIIHSTLFQSDMIARKLKKHFKVPSINSLVSNSYSKERYSKLNLMGKLKLKYSEYLNRFTLNSDFYISNSETIKNSNAKTLKINPDKIKVIYRGRDPQKMKNVSVNEIQKLKDDLNLNNKKVVLNVSRLVPSKGQDELIKAFSLIHKKHPDFVLLIAGDGKFKTELENLISSLGLTENVFLLGNRTDVPVLLEVAEIFAFPSHFEGLPGSLIESMFAGKIIVCSDIPENKECVTEKEANFFIKGDIENFAEVLDKALTGDHSFEQKKEIAKKTAFKKFDISSIADQYHETYKEVLRNYKK